MKIIGHKSQPYKPNIWLNISKKCDIHKIGYVGIIHKDEALLNKEYETILNRIKELHEIDNNN